MSFAPVPLYSADLTSCIDSIQTCGVPKDVAVSIATLLHWFLGNDIHPVTKHINLMRMHAQIRELQGLITSPTLLDVDSVLLHALNLDRGFRHSGQSVCLALFMACDSAHQPKATSEHENYFSVFMKHWFSGDYEPCVDVGSFASQDGELHAAWPSPASYSSASQGHSDGENDHDVEDGEDDDDEWKAEQLQNTAVDNVLPLSTMKMKLNEACQRQAIRRSNVVRFTCAGEQMFKAFLLLKKLGGKTNYVSELCSSKKAAEENALEQSKQDVFWHTLLE